MSLFRKELENEKRHIQALKSNEIEIVKGMKEIYHEEIYKCKFFLDLDFEQSKTPEEERLNFLDCLMRNFSDFAKNYFKTQILLKRNLITVKKEAYDNLKDEIKKKVNILVEGEEYLIEVNFEGIAEFHFAKCSETKNLHIFIEYYFYDFDDGCISNALKKVYIQFESPKNQGLFWRKFLEEYNIKSKFLDLLLYKNRPQLRTIYSNKFNANRFYYPSASYRFLNDKAEDMGIFQGNFFAGSIWSEKDTILIENENRKKKTPEIRTNYENCIFEYILNKTTIDIHKRIDWVRSAHKIYCFFAYLPIEQIREKIIKFFSIRGYSIEKYTLENHILTNEFEEKNAYCYYDIDFYANYFNVPLFFEEDCINTNKITYEDINLKKGETCIIKSGCGTQKTRQFFKAYKGETILYISYRCALAKDIKKNYGGVSYKKINPSRDECPDFLICQINSLYKFANWLDNFEYVFIDECEEIFSMLEFAISDNGDKNTSSIVKQSILTIMLKQIFLQKKVICASANITHKTFFALNNFGAKITKKINNTFLDKSGYSAFYYECPIEFSEKVYNFIFNNKKIIYASNSKKRIKELYIILSKKFPEKKILAIYNRDKEPIELQKKQEEILKDVDKNFILYDIVLYSPTIEAGVSFTKEYFDYIIGDFINSSNTYQSAYQMLFRCRYPKNKELHICINQITDKKEKEKENDKKDKKVKKVFISKEDSGEQYLQHRKNNKTFNNTNDKINFNDSFFRKIENFELLDPFNRTIILAQFFRIYSRKYFYRLLKNDLCSAGIKWNIIEKKEEPEEKKTPIKLSIDERNENQDIYNINDFCNGGHLYKRLKILDFKIDIDFVKNAYENKKIDPFNTFVAKIINYFTLKKNETFINDNEKASCMYKFIKFFEEKKNIKNSDLDNILYKFFEQKTETMNVAFQLKLTEQTKLKYLKKDEPTATRKINAINRLNAINQRLTWFLLKLTKQDNGYVKLETLNEEFLDNLKNNNFELELKKISSKLLSEDNI